MKTWIGLDDYLSQDHGVDAWLDFSIERARDLLTQLNPEEWATLVEVWRSRSPTWQRQLAQALFSLNDRRIIPLLQAMLGAESTDVALAAAESLEGRDDLYFPSERDRLVLHALLSRVTEGNKITIQALLDRIR